MRNDDEKMERAPGFNSFLGLKLICGNMKGTGMLKVMRKGDRTAPIVCCDVCGTSIDDAVYGAAVFPSLGAEGDTQEVVLVHKGACHDKAEAALRAKGSSAGWLELKRYLADAIHNAGVQIEALQQMQADHEKFGQL